MDDERHATSPSTSSIASSGFVVTPDAVANRTFTTAFRGFDQGEVRAFLRRVSEELGGAAEREAQLRWALQEAQNRAAHPEVDEEVLTSALGEHAARLLASAREQAASIRSEVEARAARMMRDAEAQISRIRSEADSLLARRVEEVDGVTANLRNAAEADARALREQVKADVEAELLAARTQGREMVAEARAARERILADLARRRHIAEVQLDQLRAARERLLGAYAVVRRTLEEATQELKMAEVEARLAAEDVGRRAPEPPPPPPPLDPDMRARQVGREDPTPAVGTPAVRATATAVRPPRVDVPSRGEPRMRPPGRPGESRPLPAAARSGPSGPPIPNVPPAPPRGLVPPEPPSILPRPVPPPPARVGMPQGPPGVRQDEQAADQPPDRVDELFARIKADRAAVAAASAPPAPPPVPAPAPVAPPSPPELTTEPSPEAAAAAAPPAPAAPSEPVVAPEAEPPEEPTTGAKTEPEAREPAPPEPEPEPAPPSPEEVDAPEPAAPTAAGPDPAGLDIADEAARARRDELLGAVEEALSRQLKRVLQDDQNEVLDRLRRKRRRHAGSPLLPADEQVGRFQEAAEAVLDDAVRAGVRFADPTASEAHAEERAGGEAAQALAREIVEPLRERVERLLGDSNGNGNSDVSDTVSAVYRQWRHDLEPLARHHALMAFARGAFAAYGEGASLRWVVEDEVPCPDCEDNALAGGVPKGQAYPTGQLHPPAHPGCRCLLVPATP